MILLGPRVGAADDLGAGDMQCMTPRRFRGASLHLRTMPATADAMPARAEVALP